MNTLHAEWTKLRTASGTLGLLLGLAVAVVGVSVAAAVSLACPMVDVCDGDPTRVGLTGVQLGQAVVAVFAVLAVGTEYSSGLILSTLAAMPRRTSVLAAKALLIGALVAVASTMGVLASVLIGRSILRGNGFTLPAMTAVLRPAAGSVLYLTLVALLCVGVAFAVRSSAAGIGVALGLLYLFPVVALAASDPTWHRRLQQIGPSTAGLGIQATVDLHELVLSPWAGLGVLALWALGWLVVGWLVLTRHDA